MPEKSPLRPFDRWGVPASLALCGLNLVAGLLGGLARMGLPGPHGGALAYHGVLMIGGFFGTLVSLRRALSVRRAGASIVPLTSGAGGAVASLGGPVEAALWCWVAAALGLLLLEALERRRASSSLPLALQMLGTGCWLAGTVLWLQGELAHEALPGWTGFVVLTLAGWRRETLDSASLTPRARGLFAAAAALLPAGLLLAVLDGAQGLPPLGRWEPAPLVWWAGCAGLAAWFLRHEPAAGPSEATGRAAAVRQASLLSYAWLLVAAVLGLGARWWPMASQGPAWHALLLGYAFGTVFAQFPQLLRSLAGRDLPGQAFILWPSWVLAASLLLRLAASGFAHPLLLGAAGLGHALAIVLWLALLLRALARRQAA